MIRLFLAALFPACDALAPPTASPFGIAVIAVALVLLAAAVIAALRGHRK